LEGLLSSQIDIPARVLSGSRWARRDERRRRQVLSAHQRKIRLSLAMNGRTLATDPSVRRREQILQRQAKRQDKSADEQVGVGGFAR